MVDTLEIHSRIEGIPVQIANGMIKLGIASNKTEAIRLAFLDYEEHHDVIKKLKEQMKKSELEEEKEEREFFRKATQKSFSKIWNTSKEDEAEKWYEEQYKKGHFYESEKE